MVGKKGMSGSTAESMEESLSFIRQVVDLYEKDQSTFTPSDLHLMFGETFHKGKINQWLSNWTANRYLSDMYRNAMGPRVLVRVSNGVYKFVDNEAAAMQYKRHKPGKMKPPVAPVVVKQVAPVLPLVAEDLVKLKPVPGNKHQRVCIVCNHLVSVLGHECIPVSSVPVVPEVPVEEKETPVMPPQEVTLHEGVPLVEVEILHTQVNDKNENVYLLKIDGKLYTTVAFAL